MTLKHLLIAGMGILPFLFAGDAKAEHGQCREYTKNISIGGRLEIGYGRACLQPDGAWEIVSLSGQGDARQMMREHIRDDLYDRSDDRVIVIDREVPVYRQPIYYYEPAPRYYYPAYPVFYGKPWHKKHRGHGHHDHGDYDDDRYDRHGGGHRGHH